MDDEARATAAMARLRATFAQGRTRALAWRMAQLRALEHLLGRERRAVEGALRADLGRSPVEAYLSEVYVVQREIAALRRGLPRWSREQAARVPLILQPGRAHLRREPLGVVVVIGPWNYPVNLVCAPLAAALAAGNCVAVKPSEMAPATAELLAEVIPRYLDSDAIALCPGGPTVVEALVDAGADHVFFTGSPAVGRIVMERAARHLTPVTLELGGKSPVYVDATVDLGVAARRILWGKMINAGQSCIAPDYVLVDRRRHGELLEALTHSLTAMYGEQPLASPDYGRIVNERHVARLGALLEGHGGHVVRGGEIDPRALYVAPTIIDGPALDSALMTEEIFGPLLPVVALSGVDEAISVIAARPAPLALYVFSTDPSCQERLVARTRTGAVCLNTTVQHFAASTLPFGGVGGSGIGRYHGRFGYEQLSQLRPVLSRPLQPEMRFAYPPLTGAKGTLLRAALGLPGRLRRGATARSAR
jgi:aldehyde dehydrogenase (NAD+)